MRLTASLVALCLAVSGTALAQTQVTPPSDTKIAPQHDPNSAPAEKFAPPLEPRAVPQTGTAEPLSNSLSRSHGVVHPPPAVDPGMSQTPPDPGPQSTPIIKPPTPDSGVAPK